MNSWAGPPGWRAASSGLLARRSRQERDGAPGDRPRLDSNALGFRCHVYRSSSPHASAPRYQIYVTPELLTLWGNKGSASLALLSRIQPRGKTTCSLHLGVSEKQRLRSVTSARALSGSVRPYSWPPSGPPQWGDVVDRETAVVSLFEGIPGFSRRSPSRCGPAIGVDPARRAAH